SDGVGRLDRGWTYALLRSNQPECDRACGVAGISFSVHAARRFATDAKQLDLPKHHRRRRFPSRHKVVLAPSVLRRGGNADRNYSTVSIQKTGVSCRSCGCGAELPNDPARPVYRTGGANSRSGLLSRNDFRHGAKKMDGEFGERKKAPTGRRKTLPAKVNFFPAGA